MESRSDMLWATGTILHGRFVGNIGYGSKYAREKFGENW